MPFKGKRKVKLLDVSSDREIYRGLTLPSRWVQIWMRRSVHAITSTGTEEDQLGLFLGKP